MVLTVSRTGQSLVEAYDNEYYEKTPGFSPNIIPEVFTYTLFLKFARKMSLKFCTMMGFYK